MLFFSMKGDVYPVEQSDGFTIKPVLDAHWGVLNDEDVRKLMASWFQNYNLVHVLRCQGSGSDIIYCLQLLISFFVHFTVIILLLQITDGWFSFTYFIYASK